MDRALAVYALLFWDVTNATVYHLSQYHEPSPASTLELHVIV